MSVSVGIDLGTTFSAVAYIDPQTKLPQIVPNSEGRKLTPSVIQFLDGELIFGSEAQESYNAGEDDCVATFKREMGSDRPYCFVDGKAYTSEELSSLLLRHLKEDAEASLGDTIKEAVITVPAYFYSREREATIRAAEAAGLRVKKIIDEPNAAAMAYGLNHWRENASIMVYDLGGGTFDVTLVHMGKNGELSTITTRGNHKLGGRDWDARMEDILIAKFENETGLSIRDDHELVSIVNGMSEGVKKQLSAQNMLAAKASVSFPGYGNAVVTVTRKEFEDSTADLLDRTGALCLAVLDEAGLAIGDVTDVLLVGGSTRMPQVPAYLQKMFGKKPLSHVNPDEAVALGAAIQSSKDNESYATLAVRVVDGKKTTDRSKTGLNSHLSVKAEKKLNSLGLLSLRETTAHAMGVIAINDEENRYYNEIIIPANHPRPVRAAKRFRFYTSNKANNELAIYVLQGDSENPLDCQITYKYVVTGIKHKTGTVIKIQYSYDVNGVIHIQARQDDDTVDLPIRRENVPADISVFGQPVKSENKDQGFNVGLQLGVINTQSVVHKYKPITFSNVEWVKYDNVSDHPNGDEFDEPKVHIIANEENIEFHGYNISEMNEGVKYTISPFDDFEIECDINTSTISPHPGGYLEISLGLISAQLTENGGDILMDGVSVATVDPCFHLKMSLTKGGQYEVEIDGKTVGSKFKASTNDVDVRFGFVHGSHYCHLLSHAYVTDISMMQAVAGETDDDDSPDTEPWDD
ncbi:molecular chaperone DnaK [Ruminococcaceae bacterium YRB3002]|nr:molecular chaperone DnaK [Ruminococcaceae bacterium YRB3002]